MEDFYNNKNLGLFFSYGVGVGTWEKQGYLSRESKYYTGLAAKLGKVFFFTYDVNRKLQKHSFENGCFNKIAICPKKIDLPNLFYYFLMPFLLIPEIKKCDVLKTNQMSAVLPAIIAKLIYRKKLIVRCGYEWLYSLIKAKKPFWKKVIVHCLEFLAYKAADKIIFTSKADRAFAQKKFRIPESKIVIIPNYIDTDLFGPMPAVKKEPNSVCFVGRLSKEKNISALIAALADLPQMKLYVVGDGPEREAWQKQANRLGLQERVIFLGKVPNEQVPEIIKKCAVFVLPSKYEGNPKALLEARSCGTTLTIASNIEAHREIINQDDGYLYSLHNVAELKEKIQDVVKELQEKRFEYREKAKKARDDIIRNKEVGLNEVLRKEIALIESL